MYKYDREIQPEKRVLHSTLMTYTWTLPTYFSYQSPLSRIFHSNQKILPKITQSWTIFLHNRSQTDVHCWLVVRFQASQEMFQISSNIFTCLTSMYNINFDEYDREFYLNLGLNLFTMHYKISKRNIKILLMVDIVHYFTLHCALPTPGKSVFDTIKFQFP